LVNACRAPGVWQTYDIIYTAPKFDTHGKLTRKAHMTVLHNGVLIQNNVALWGFGGWKKVTPYRKHPDALPLALQDHHNPVKYRNIWIRPIKD